MEQFGALYESKKMSAEQIAGNVQSNWVCASDIGLSLPPAILGALDKHVTENNLYGIDYHTMLEWFPASIYNPEYKKHYRGVSWFSNGFARKAVNQGFADVMPAYFHDIPAMIEGHAEIDAIFICVAPMDERGYFSTGVSASLSEALIKKAKRIYLEVNENMPRSLTEPAVHISKVDGLCENHIELPDLPRPEIDDISKQIAAYIADEIPNGAVIQFGIGAIPDAVGLALQEKRNLSIHTEMFTESMIDLIESGAVTNKRKPLHMGKTVASFAFGSKRVYDYIHNNPDVKMLPVQCVNDPNIIRSIPNFMSINSAIEVDFFGQVCAESIGTMHFSGTGGQVDFVRGAVLSNGGKSFLAFPSTAKGGTVSRIKSTLTPGAIVTTSKNDVDYIATEYGIAKLRGKTLGERTKALIRIAHPKFRQELTREAKERNILL
ncbi:4-hydroxybutyrate CoA-transferase [Ralstonia pickettii]|nr:4-hydroxybutyrate CoA-transferase [Ralstonia pickettii]